MLLLPGESPYPSTPGFYPIAAAAKLAGVSVDLFKRGVDAGQIDVRIQRIGRRYFIGAASLQAWLRATKSPTVDLFRGIS